MTLRKFNDTFYKFRPEPKVDVGATITKAAYEGVGGRWYMDIEVKNMTVIKPLYDQLRSSCPGSFVEGSIKLKIPMMKGQWTYLHKHPTRLTDIGVGENVWITMACAGMFDLKGVWKPSWKLKVLSAYTHTCADC